MFGSYAFLFAFSLAALGFAIGGLFLVRKFVSHQTLILHHDVAGYLLSIVGTLYSVVLGLIVVGSLNTFQQARITVAQEANSLHDIFHLVAGLPEPVEKHMRANCLQYANILVNEEWKAMESGKSSDKAHLVVYDMWNTLARYQPKTQGESDLHSVLLSEMNGLEDNRSMRLTAAAPVYDFIIWMVLVGGGTILVVFTYFFSVKNLVAQIAMTSMVTIVLSLNMVVVALFGSPYSGDVRVDSQPFELLISKFQRVMTGDTNKHPLD
jgi:hypothetical protein